MRMCITSKLKIVAEEIRFCVDYSLAYFSIFRTPWEYLRNFNLQSLHFFNQRATKCCSILGD